jgi:tRNA threonylcarbamoyladenosine biosynthesis protein TsaB
MRILAFDTATSATAVALLDTATGIAIERRDDPAAGERPHHTTRLMGLLVEALNAGGARWEDVDRLAVGIGPGTFTGLRIGVATARALARAREIPLVGVPTLHALASGALATTAVGGGSGDGGADAAGVDAVMAVIDARRGEVFAAGWPVAEAADPGARPLRAPRALSPDALADEMLDAGRSWLAVGTGAVEFRTALERSGAWIPEEDSERNRVSAVAHCRLAAGLRPEPPEGVRPEYLRLPDAEISLRAARPQ